MRQYRSAVVRRVERLCLTSWALRAPLDASDASSQASDLSHHIRARSKRNQLVRLSKACQRSSVLARHVDWLAIAPQVGRVAAQIPSSMLHMLTQLEKVA